MRAFCIGHNRSAFRYTLENDDLFCILRAHIKQTLQNEFKPNLKRFIPRWIATLLDNMQCNVQFRLHKNVYIIK